MAKVQHGKRNHVVQKKNETALRGKVQHLEESVGEYTCNKLLQKRNFDRAHRARAATSIVPWQPVWVMPSGVPGTVVRSLPFRSYEVQTPSGRQRRNQRHLIPREHMLKPHVSFRDFREANPLIPSFMGCSEEEDGPVQETVALRQPYVAPSSFPSSQVNPPSPSPV